jgi:hypothetical protein
VDYWAQKHPDERLEELAVNFYTPKDAPENVVMVVIALDADDTDVASMRDLRNRLVRIARQGAVGDVVIDARTLDSEIVVTGRRRYAGRGDGDG